MFVNQSKSVLTKEYGQIDGNAFICRNLVDCSIYLCDLIGSVYIDDCSNCVFYTGPVKSSLFMRGCSSCQLHTVVNQLRISNSENIEVFGFSSTQTTLEKVNNLLLGPHLFTYPQLRQQINESNFQITKNRIFKVHDFTPSDGNWAIVEPASLPSVSTYGYSGEGDAMEEVSPIPLPVYFGGELVWDIFCIKDEDDTNDNDYTISGQLNTSSPSTLNSTKSFKVVHLKK